MSKTPDVDRWCQLTLKCAETEGKAMQMIPCSLFFTFYAVVNLEVYYLALSVLYF